MAERPGNISLDQARGRRLIASKSRDQTKLRIAAFFFIESVH
jgi:hypothetical protein